MISKTIIDPSLSEAKFRSDLVVIRVNKFNEEAAKKFSEEMGKAHNSEQPIIPVVIDSYGGQVDSLLAMISCIENAEKPVATIVQGKAMSCGSVLMTCGTKGYRYIDPHARVMIHEISAAEWAKTSELEAKAEEVVRLNKYIFALMAKNSGKPKAYFLEQMKERSNADWYLTSKQALQEGLTDSIYIPKLVRSVTVEYIFE